ncbi:hypothetical protein [Azospirillum sp. sgz302134]
MSDTTVDTSSQPVSQTGSTNLPVVTTPAAPPSNDAVVQNEKGKANSLLNTIADKLDQLTTLTVVTAVCDVETVQADPNRPTFTCRPKSGTAIDAFQTQVNLVTGDIENLISRDFATNAAYKDLSDFHLAQVTKSSDIVSANLKAVRDLAVQLSGRTN